MLTNVDIKVGGRFKLEVIKPNGDVTVAADWFANLILNQGLDKLAGTSNFLDFAQCGSGSNVPATSDVQLQTFIAGRAMDAQPSVAINSTDRYAYVTRAYTFAIGAATGNISEIGVGTLISGPNLFSRALVKDINGSPTTITVLADEQLRITYEFRVYQPIADIFTGTVNGYNVVARSASVNSINVNGGWYLPSSFSLQSGLYGSVTDGAIGPITGAPTGTGMQLAPYMQATQSAYVSGTFTRDVVLTFGPNDFNMANGIGAIVLPYGPTQFQFGFIPKIMKTNVQSLKITLRYTWARKTL